MLTISKTYSFDSAHILDLPGSTPEENVKLFGKCHRLHGHTYQLAVTITGNLQVRTGMILNYFDLDKVMGPLIALWDHRNLNDVFKELAGRTTAENMVNRMAFHIQHALDLADTDVKLYELRLQETPKTSAVWRRE